MHTVVWFAASFVLATPAEAIDSSARNDRTIGLDIEIGRRARGSHRGQTLPLVDDHVVRLDDLALEWMETYDAQLGQRQWYRGISLARLFDAKSEIGKSNLALLRFANGMIVPVPMAPASLEPIFVAREMKRSKSAAPEPEFPSVSRKLGLNPDPRPISFGRNKVVVERLDHPFAPDPRTSMFSPWAYVDTLVAIELVDRAGWEAQFDAGPSVSGGREVFLTRCQYCHGVKDVGATFGWDFVDPTPLFEYRSPQSLYPHVRFENSMARAVGANMPPQKDVLFHEVELLWAWMRAIAQSGPRPYE